MAAPSFCSRNLRATRIDFFSSELTRIHLHASVAEGLSLKCASVVTARSNQGAKNPSPKRLS
jgi:hypothetical protein